MIDPADQIAVARGLQAEALLKNELISEAFSILTQRVLDEFAKTDPRNEKELAYQRRMLQCVSDLRGIFKEFVAKGENAQARIKDNERRSLLSRLNA